MELQDDFSFESSSARVRVTRMRDADVRACVELIVDAFADTPDAKPRAFVLKYLIGATTRRDGEECALVAKSLDDDRVVGFVSVSVTADARAEEKNRDVAVPSDAAYLANACVAREARRRGVGGALVRATEALVLDMGGCDVWLHVRADDVGASALYAKEGYDEVARERAGGVFSALFGGGGAKSSAPRALMRKVIKPGSNFMLS